MFYSGGVKAEKGVAVVLRNNVKRLAKVECCSDRLMFVKISVKPVDIVLVQVYMPTANHDKSLSHHNEFRQPIICLPLQILLTIFVLLQPYFASIPSH